MRPQLLYNARIPSDRKEHDVSIFLGRGSWAVCVGMPAINWAARGALIAVILVGASLLAACGGGEDSPEAVHGKLTDVQTKSFTEIESFSLLDETGETWLFATEGPLEFTPSHLRKHMLIGEKVNVQYKRRAGIFVALSISDYP